jgi:hypothetical protein
MEVTVAGETSQICGHRSEERPTLLDGKGLATQEGLAL